MAALHSISTGLSADKEKENGQYKSPDYQKSMTKFREDIWGISDYEKIHLFLNGENVIPDEIAKVEGISATENKKRGEKHNKHFAPFIKKKKLIWS
jgi:hypothetical protein